MDYKYRCKNHHSRLYKCTDWVENHDACKNCELRAIETVVFTIHYDKIMDCYFIRSDAKEMASSPVRAAKLFSVMKEFKDYSEREGFKAVFEVA